MCAGDDKNCPEFELHHRKFKETLDRERRSFLRSSFAAAGGAAAMTAGGISLVTPQMAAAAEKNQPAKRSYHHLPANADTVHWGYFSKKLKPQVEIDFGDFITIEALTHHANDDAERMVKGDPGAESVFLWTKEKKGVNRRGAGPMDASLFGRGAGEGLGVHICTGPVYVRGAQEGDVIELRIIDVTPRPCANPQYPGKAFGSNAAAWWGFHYKDLLTEPKPREVITIYEVDATGERNWAKAVYNFRWTPQTDPSGVVAQDHRLSRRSRRSLHDQGEPRHPEECAHSDTSAFRRHRPGAQGSRYRRLDSAELYRRQHRQLADRQGRHDVLSGRGRRRPVVGRRLARFAGQIPSCAVRQSNAR